MPSQNVDRFVASFMQAISGCGPVISTSYSPDRRVTHVTHQDGCVLDVPDEAMQAMTPDQQTTAFGLVSGTTLPPAIPAPAPVDVEVEVDQDRIRRSMSTEARTDNAIENSSFYGNFQAQRRDTRRTVTQMTRRGERFLGLLAANGITLPAATRRVVGQILEHLYGDMEGKIMRATEREQRLQDDYRDRIRQANESVEAHKAAAITALASATKLEKLRAAAIAWRETAVEESKPVEKFAKFQALMNAIDATPDGFEDTEITVEVPSAELPSREDEAVTTPPAMASQPF